MKRLSEYFAANAASKKPKAQVEPPPNIDTSPQPSNESKTAPESQSTDPKKNGFQRSWLANDRFISWLTYNEKQNHMKCSLCHGLKHFSLSPCLCLSTGKSNPFVSGCVMAYLYVFSGNGPQS